MNITQSHIDKLNKALDAGLCYGKGIQEPGKMCVEAAVCYALDLPHSDEPPCVSPAIRAVKLRLNDSCWSSNIARANGLRKLAIAQLGSAGVIDDVFFARRLAELTIRRALPRSLRRAGLEQNAIECESLGSEDAAYAAARAANDASSTDSTDFAAYAAARAANATAYAAANAAEPREDFLRAYHEERLAAITAYAASRAADAAYAASRAAYAAYTASRAAADADADADADAELVFFADLVFEVLTEMNAPGIKWLKNEK